MKHITAPLIRFTFLVLTFLQVNSVNASVRMHAQTSGVNAISACPDFLFDEPELHTCEGSTINIHPQLTGDFDSVVWFGGAGAFVPDRRNINVDYSPSASEYGNTVTFTVVAYGRSCPNDTLLIQLVVDRPIIAIASRDTQVCSNASIQVNVALSGSNNSGHWIGGDGYFTPSANLTNPFYHPASTDSAAYLIFIPDAGANVCPSTSDTTIVVVIPAPTATAMPDDSACFPGFIRLSGSTDPRRTFDHWSGGADVQFTPDRFQPRPKYDFVVGDTGQALVFWMVAIDNGCADSDQVVIHVIPTAVDAGPDLHVCERGSVQLNGSYTGLADKFEWSGGSGSFSPSDADLQTFYFPSPNEAGTTVTLTLEGSARPGCHSIEDEVVITVDRLVSVAATGGGLVCFGNPLSLTGTFGGGAIGGHWSGGVGDFIPDRQGLAVDYLPALVEVGSPVNLYFVADIDPSNVCPSDSAQLIVVVDSVPIATVSNDTTVCSGATVTVSGTIIMGNGNQRWLTTGDGTFSAFTALRTDYTPGPLDITNGGVTLVLAPDPNGACDPVQDSLRITYSTTSLTATASSGTILCNGGVTTVTVTASGGTAPYTGTGTFTFPAGSYNLSVVDSNRCATIVPLIITQPQQLVASAVGGIINCNGGSSTFTVAATGGTGAYSGIGTFVRTAGTYSFTVSDASGCTATTAVTLINPAPLAINIAAGTIQCFDASVNVSVSANGGTPPYTGTGLFTRTAGTYTFTVSDSRGCSSTGSITLAQPALLQATAAATQAACPTCANGSVNITSVTGGTGTPLYNNLSGIVPGTYCITVTDGNGCSTSACATVTSPNCAISITPTTVPVGCYGDSVTVNVTVSNNIGSYTVTGPQRVVAGTYLYSVVDSVGCRSSASLTVQQPSRLAVSIQQNITILCYGGLGELQAMPTGGTPPYTYRWNNNATTAVNSNLAAGTYSLTVSDANGCTVAGTSILTQPPNPIAIDPTISLVGCTGQNNGSIDIKVSGGSGPYTFLWSNGATTEDISGLVVGTYSVTITDRYGCTKTFVLSVTQAPQLVVSGNNSSVTCSNPIAGSLTATVTGGTPVYTYVWSTGATTASISLLSVGTYTVTVTDSKGCTATKSFSVTNPNTTLAISPAITNVSCSGGADGIISLTVSGATGAPTFLWSTGATTPSIYGLRAGSYSVTVVDQAGCSISSAISVTQPQPLVITASVVNIACANTATGSITASVTGGTPGYTYSWSNVTTGPSLINLAAGIYTVTTTDSRGCTASSSFTVTQPPVFTLSSTQTNVRCFGGSDGAIDLTPTGGVLPYTYSWSNGATTQDLSGLTPGTYTVTVTDSNRCVRNQPVTISQPPSALSVLVTGVSSAGCSNTGAITLTVSGGYATSYSYAWSNGATVQNPTGLAAGFYAVVVTDAGGCTATAAAQVNSTGGAPVLSPSIVNNTCYGQAAGSISLQVTGGSAPYTFAWSNSATTAVISNLVATTYTVTVRDALGCTTTQTYAVTAPPKLVLTSTKVNVACTGAATGAIDLTVSGGTPGYLFLWSNGQRQEDLSQLSAGIYQVTVSDANGCTATRSDTITQPALPLTLSSTQSNVKCPLGNNGTIDLTVSGGVVPYRYLWSNGQTTEDLSGLIAGAYQVSVTDQAGCVRTLSTTILQPDTFRLGLTAHNVDCFGRSTGSVSSSVTGGTSPYTYVWRSGTTTYTTQTVSNLAAGTYTFTVTDLQSCTAISSLTVTQPAKLHDSAVVTNVKCFGLSTGAIDLTVSGGVRPYSYTWSPSGQRTEDINGLAAGLYRVSVLDSNGCSLADSFVVRQPVAPITVTDSVTNIACYGNRTGKIDLTVTGGTPNYTYLWNNGATTQDLTGLVAGLYSVTIRDSNNCTASYSKTLTQPTVLQVRSTVTNVLCYGNSTGSIIDSVSGGTPGYTYSWSNGVSGQIVINNLSAGPYTLTVTDSKGCTLAKTDTVKQPLAPLTLRYTKIDNLCFGGATGFIDLDARGGTTPYSYAWSNGQTVADIGSLSAGTYSVRVTDANGCTKDTSVTITQPVSPMTVADSITNLRCFQDNSGSIRLNVTGGTPGSTIAYTYRWSNGRTTRDITGLAAGTYTVTVTDANGCTTTRTYTVTQPAALSITSTVNNILCNGQSNGSIAISVIGGTSAYTYQWVKSPGILLAATTNSVNNLSAGSYVVTVTDANQCTATKSFTVLQPDPLSVIDSIKQVSCYQGSDGAISLYPRGGTAPYSYLWTNGSTSRNISNLSGAYYGVTVTDANGCTFTGLYEVKTPLSAVGYSSQVTGVRCYGQANGSISVVASGGNSPYSYVWSTGATTNTISNLSAGSYSVAITDSNGCEKRDTFTVLQPAAISIVLNTVNLTCFGSSNGSITSAVSGGNPNPRYSYLWAPVGLNSTQLSNLASGTYTLTITDGNNCTATAVTTVTQPSPISIVPLVGDVTCNGGTNGSIQLGVSGGSGSYSYDWGGGVITPNRNGLAAGTYTVVVTDGNGCSKSQSITVSQPALLSVSLNASPVVCNGASTGSIVASTNGGVAPYSYFWTPGGSGGSIRSNLSAGTYSVVVTDSKGCTTGSSTVVSQAAPFSLPLQTTNVSCYGGSNGSINALPVGGVAPISYAWSNGQTVASLSALSAATYSVVATDFTGCTATSTAVVNQPAPLSVVVNGKLKVCYGGSDGNISLSVTGGTQPYSVSWDAGGAGSSISGLRPGIYSALITDANGCSLGQSVSISENPRIQTSVTVTTAYCTLPGGAAVVASGGTSPYAYLWSNGATTSAQSGLTAQRYTVIVTDAIGCSASDTALVPYVNAAPPVPGPISGPIVVCNNSNNTVTYSVSPVPGATSYRWVLPSRCTGSSTTNSITVNFQGGYNSGSICVSGVNPCGTGVASCLTVNQSNTRPAAVGPVSGPAYACGGGTYTYVVAAIPSAATYNWTITGVGASIVSGQGTSTVQVSTLAGFSTATLTVNGENCNGSGAAASLQLYGIPDVVAALTGNTIPCQGSTGNYSIPAVAGAQSYVWSVSGNATIASSSGSSCSVQFASNWNGGVLSVQVINPCGARTLSFNLTAIPVQPVVISGPASNLCVTAPNGSITVTYSCTPVTGASAYNWTVPRGMTIIANNGSSITVEVKKQFISGSVCVNVVTACSSTNSACLSVSSLPAAPVITGAVAPCRSSRNEPYAIVPVSGITSYQWSITGGAILTPAGNAATVNFTSTIGAASIVSASMSNACGTGPVGSLNVTINNGCRMMQSDEIFALFPNPTGGLIALHATGLDEDVVVVGLMDMTGADVLSDKIPVQHGVLNSELDLSGIAPGIYLLKLDGGTGSYHREARISVAR